MQDFAELTQGAPGATVILAVILIASLLTLFVRPDWLERGLFRPYWLFRRQQFATLVTSVFLHADLSHLLFNGFTFWAFAFSLERQIGTPSFLALYAAGSLVSDLGTWVKQRENPAYQTLGASGAIMAVLFASILYFPGASLYILPIPVPIPAPIFAVGYLAYTIWASKQAHGRVNHDAHLGGALAGIAFVALTDPATLTHAITTFIGRFS